MTGIHRPALTETTEDLDIYVKDSGGDDSNDGLSTSTALKSLQRAFDLYVAGKQLRNKVTIHLGVHSGSGYPMPVNKQIFTDNLLTIVGDGAGTGDGWTELEASAAAGSGTDQDIIKGSGYSVNEHQGKIIEMLSGDAAGEFRTIRDHTTTDIFPVRPFLGSPAMGDNFRIIEPAVDIRFDEEGLSGEYQAFHQAGRFHGDESTNTDRSGVVFGQLRFSDASGRLVVFSGGTYAFFACEYDLASGTKMIFNGCDVWMGTDDPVDGNTARLAAGLPGGGGGSEWPGAGLANVGTDNGLVFEGARTRWIGYYVGKFCHLLGEQLDFRMMGGRLIGTPGVITLHIKNGNKFTMEGQDDNSDTTEIESSNERTVVVEQPGSFFYGINGNVNCTGFNQALNCNCGGAALVTAGMAGESNSGYSVDARQGGRVYLEGGVNFGRAVGDDYTTGDGTDLNKTDFASGTFSQNGASVIHDCS